MSAFTGPNLPDLLVVVGSPVPATDTRPRWTASEGASFSSYDLYQLGAPTLRTTTVGAGTASQTLLVVTTALILEGHYITIGAQAPVRVLIVSSDGTALYLAEPRTWTNGQNVSYRPANPLAIGGVTYNGIWGGSPLASNVFTEVFARGTSTDGDTADSNLFTFTASPAPNPPVFNPELPIDDHNFVIGDGTQLVEYALSLSNFPVGTVFSVRPGDPALPATYSLNAGTGRLTILDTVPAAWIGAIRATKAGEGFSDSNVSTQTMDYPSSSLVGDLRMQMRLVGTITVERNRRVTGSIPLPLVPASQVRVVRNRTVAGNIPIRIILDAASSSSHGPANYSLLGNIPIRMSLAGTIAFSAVKRYVSRALYAFAPELRLYTFFSGDSMNTVYLGRDNAFSVGLLSREKPISAAAFTRYVLYMEAPDGTVVTIDSAVKPFVFDVTQSGYFFGESAPVLRLKLGLVNQAPSSGLVAGTTYQCYLRAYDAINVNGLVWPEDNQRFAVTVLSGP